MMINVVPKLVLNSRMPRASVLSAESFSAAAARSAAAYHSPSPTVHLSTSWLMLVAGSHSPSFKEKLCRLCLKVGIQLFNHIQSQRESLPGINYSKTLVRSWAKPSGLPLSVWQSPLLPPDHPFTSFTCQSTIVFDVGFFKLEYYIRCSNNTLIVSVNLHRFTARITLWEVIHCMSSAYDRRKSPSAKTHQKRKLMPQPS